MLLDRVLPSFSNLLGSHKPLDRLWLLILWSCLLLLGHRLRLRRVLLMGEIRQMPREGRLGFGKVVVPWCLIISIMVKTHENDMDVHLYRILRASAAALDQTSGVVEVAPAEC